MKVMVYGERGGGGGGGGGVSKSIKKWEIRIWVFCVKKIRI